jgi:hypothetical protein
MARPRATLLAAVVVAAGSVAPSAARGQGDPPDPAVSVLPPRALPLPALPLMPAGAVPAADFAPAATVGAPTAGPPGSSQRMPVGTPVSPGAAGAPSVWLAAPTEIGGAGAPTNRAPSQPAAGRPQYPSPTTTWQPAPVTAVPSPAPAWRWHGYGAVNNGTDAGQPTPQYQSPQSPSAAQPPSAPMNTPTGSSVIAAPDAGPAWQPPGTIMPAAPPPVNTAPAEALPLSVEPSWRPAGEKAAAAPLTAPTRVAYEPWTAVGQRVGTTNPMVAASAPDADWRGNGVVAARPAPLPPGSYTPRAVSDAPPMTVRQASYTNPVPPAPPPAAARPPRPAAPAAAGTPRPAANAANRPPVAPPTVAALRAGIERACAGRGRDVEVYARGASSLLVRVKVRQAADAEFLANRLSQLSELAPFQVLYEMQVTR